MSYLTINCQRWDEQNRRLLLISTGGQGEGDMLLIALITIANQIPVLLMQKECNVGEVDKGKAGLAVALLCHALRWSRN